MFNDKNIYIYMNDTPHLHWLITPPVVQPGPPSSRATGGHRFYRTTYGDSAAQRLPGGGPQKTRFLSEHGVWGKESSMEVPFF